MFGRRIPAAFALAALIFGCAAAPPPQARSPRQAATAMNAAARRAFDLVNAERTARGLAPLAFSAACTAAAQDHAEDMVERRFYSHRSPTESFTARMARWGLLKEAVAENIGEAATAAAVVESWLGSRGHRANILNRVYRSSGVGCAGDYFVQCFSAAEGN